jgi:hypothetical protein
MVCMLNWIAALALARRIVSVCRVRFYSKNSTKDFYSQGSEGLYSEGLYSEGLYSEGLYSEGLYSEHFSSKVLLSSTRFHFY